MVDYTIKRALCQTRYRSSMAKRGRPATFDRNEALERALELFWARGYEGATLEDLQAVMGNINPPSFYHAFGSKEALFREAVDLYVSAVGGPSLRALEESKTAREGVDALLRLTARSLSRPGKAHGCLLVRGATNTAPANRGAQDYLLAIRQRPPRVIKARLDRAIAEGELPRNLDTSGLAAFYTTVLHGLGMRAGDGASQAALMAAVDGAMAAWEPLTSRVGANRRRSAPKGAAKSRKASGR
jgi:AcrR family transcriptional regulator